MPKGIVETTSKKEVKTKFGLKPTYSVKVDGEWYSNGFTDPRVSAGDEIAFEYTDGKYGREFDKGSVMRISKGADTPTPAAAPAAAPKSFAPAANRPFPIPPLHGDRAIIRQNALSHAARIIASDPAAFVGGHDRDAIAAAVIAMARKFEAYSCGDLDAEAAKAKLVNVALAEELDA